MNTKLKRNAFDLFERTKQSIPTFIEGHRGVNRELEQNTMISFNKAIEYNLDSLELDVWLTQDKVPVIIHAGDLGEIEDNTNSEGNINHLTLSALQNIQSKEMNQPIPTLEEVFQLGKDRIFINIELKDFALNETFDQVIRLVEKYQMSNQIAISSFKHGYYDLVQKYMKEGGEKIEFGFLYEEKFEVKGFPNTPFNWNVTGISYNIYQKDITLEFVEKAHKNGNCVVTWFKMKDEENDEVYERLFKSGVDAICCNLPVKAREFRDKYESHIREK